MTTEYAPPKAASLMRIRGAFSLQKTTQKEKRTNEER